MKISYAVTVCNELTEISKLLPFLMENKREKDDVVVFFDSCNGTKQVEDNLRASSQKTYAKFRWMAYHFDGHFAHMKNALTEACLGDYIFQIDADEMVSKEFMEMLPEILESNQVDVLRVPRINTVSGLTTEHVRKWGWSLSKIESPNLIAEKEIDTESQEYVLLKEGGFVIEETEIG